MLLVANASASSQLPGLDGLSDDRKKPRDEQGICALTHCGERFIDLSRSSLQQDHRMACRTAWQDRCAVRQSSVTP